MQSHAVLFLMFVLAGCGQASETTTNIPAQATSPAPTAALDAGGVINALKATGLPITEVNVLTEATDTNKMMGRPNGYTSKAFFVDQRHEGEGVEPSEQNTVEVFPDADGATRRREFIEGVTKEMPMFTQYIIQSGPILLRLDKVVTPTEAKEYEEALAKL